MGSLERYVRFHYPTVSVLVEKDDFVDDFAGRSAKRCRRDNLEGRHESC